MRSRIGGGYATRSISLVDRPGLHLDWSRATTSKSPTPSATGRHGSTAGLVMLTFDSASTLTLQVADADHFVIHNACGAMATGSLSNLTAPASSG
jgi:hypothetical protein